MNEVRLPKKHLFVDQIGFEFSRENKKREVNQRIMPLILLLREMRRGIKRN